MPKQLFKVTPLTLMAATPVGAVTRIFPQCRRDLERKKPQEARWRGRLSGCERFSWPGRARSYARAVCGVWCVVCVVCVCVVCVVCVRVCVRASSAVRSVELPDCQHAARRADGYASRIVSRVTHRSWMMRRVTTLLPTPPGPVMKRFCV